MEFKIRKKKLVNPKEIEIWGEDYEDFWNHHDRRDKEKEHLRYLARILPSAVKKKQKGLHLNDDEEYSHNIFVDYGPIVSYYAEEDCYSLADGRHRMCMLRDENIQLEMYVWCNFNFSDLIKYPIQYFKFFFIRNKKQKSSIIVKPKYEPRNITVYIEYI